MRLACEAICKRGNGSASSSSGQGKILVGKYDVAKFKFVCDGGGNVASALADAF